MNEIPSSHHTFLCKPGSSMRPSRRLLASKRERLEQEPTDTPAKSHEGKAPLFVYPSLPFWESALYATILATAMSIAWYKVFQLGTSPVFTSSDRVRLRKSSLPLLGERLKDVSNFEWYYWSLWIKKSIVFYLVHVALFNGASCYICANNWRKVMLAYWLFACCCLFPVQVVASTLVVCVLMLLIAKYVRSKLLLWASVIGMLYLVVEGVLRIDEANMFEAASFIGYKMVHCLTFCIHLVDSRQQATGTSTSLLQDVVELMWYLLYFPYQLSLIIIYPKFKWQMESRDQRLRKWKSITWFALRMAFWYCFNHALLHFFYFEAATRDAKLLNEIDLLTLSSLGLLIGQFFFLKYVVIFGVPSLFAKLDNMVPPEPPMCTSAVSLFSQMWRHFDRGLYDFFKEYIFVPICRPSFSVPRRLVALLMCFFFVLVWHGLRHNCAVWVALNIVEILMETTAKSVYSTGPVRRWREANMSDKKFRRLLAVLQLFPLSTGYYSNFYFLGGSQFGRVLVDRIFWAQTFPRLRLPALLLLSLGYCYNNVNMDVRALESFRVTKGRN